MSIVLKSKKKAAEFMLRRELRNFKRVIRSTSLNKASTVALLFDATNKQDFEIVKNFIKKLKEDGKKVHALGFYNFKETPVMMNSKLEYDFFTLKDINWHYKPTSKLVINYMGETFDILINLCAKTVLPIMYVLSKSKSKFKVGPYKEKYVQHYDLMVEQDNDGDLKNFIQNVEKYLQFIQ